MDIRPPKHPDEFRDALFVIQRAWRAAFTDIIDEETLANLDFGTDDDENVTDRFESWTDASDRSMLVVLEDEEVVATGSLIWGEAMKPFAEESDVELRTIYVDPKRWGEGIGTTLLTSLLAEVPAAADRLVLETLTENEIGTAFYRTQGFYFIDTYEFTIDDETYPTTVFGRALPQ